MPRFKPWSVLLGVSFILVSAQGDSSETVSALFASDYTVLPSPQNVSLTGKV